MIAKMNPKQCQSFWNEQLCPVRESRWPCACWRCGERMVFAENVESAGCMTRPCQKSRITSAATAYTPPYTWKTGGCEVDYQLLLRTMYALGCKLPNDAAVRMIRREIESYRACYNQVSRIWAELRLCLAWQAQLTLKTVCVAETCCHESCKQILTSIFYIFKFKIELTVENRRHACYCFLSSLTYILSSLRKKSNTLMACVSMMTLLKLEADAARFGAAKRKK